MDRLCLSMMIAVKPGINKGEETQMKKSILSLALAVIMVMALLTVGAFADGTTLTVGEGETYETISAALADAHDGDTIYIKMVHMRKLLRLLVKR